MESVLLVMPTYVQPSRAKKSAEASQEGAVSKPAVEFHHSMTTVPFAASGSVGRLTRMRVR